MVNEQSLYTMKIKLAGHVGLISSPYRISPHMYKDFRTEDAEDFLLTIEDEDIDFSAIERFNNNKITVIIPRILQKFAESLLAFDILLMHGAVIALNGKAYMFTAISGTGKTTHILKWLVNCPDTYVINGDKPFIKFNKDGNVLACGSPWAGKENLYTNTMVPLNAIILMERAKNNKIEPISFKEAFPFLIQQTHRPNCPEKLHKTLNLLQKLDSSVSFYRFKFNNFKEDCFDVAYNGLITD